MADDTMHRTNVEDGWARLGTAASLLVALSLLALKIWAWRATDSTAVLGAAADSGLDVVGSLVAFMAVRYAALPADADHTFGHQKAEALSALFQSIVITASAIFVAWESIDRLLHPQVIERTEIAVWVLAGSAMATVLLVGFQTLALRRSGSLVVEGDRAHYLGDVIANLGALFAVFLASAFGILRADALAGLLAAAFLLWSVREIGTAALPQIMDQELPAEDIARIRGIVQSDPDVLGHHALRTRRAGRRRYVQMHLELDPDMTLLQSHAIADRVERTIEAIFPDTDVITHQDPYGVIHDDGPPQASVPHSSSRRASRPQDVR